MNNVEQKRLEIKCKFLQKGTRLNKSKDIVNGKNLDKNKFVVTVVSCKNA